MAGDKADAGRRPGLEEGCKLHKLWEAPDKEARLATRAEHARDRDRRRARAASTPH